MELRVKRLHPEAALPRRATDGAAGFDLTAIDVDYLDGITARYRTGIAVEIPAGYVGLLVPRSSVWRTGLSLANSVGVIDSDYRGEVMVVFRWDQEGTFYAPGDRVAQLVLVPAPVTGILEVSELAPTQRGAGGFGSTGT